MTLNEYLSYIILPVLGIAVLLIVYRFIKGPSMADKIIALDVLITTGIGIIGVYSITHGRSTFLDTALILALIAFLSTVAFSYYLEKRNRKK
ncbi:multisubunit sodium/proton antiporter, MrpF subunit [Salegentibacter echinorum]|uniref:Multisubunit sodium/proton antiporter, MrpF subunit n=1 Tax=Salegentibacter echinorum TaxID=1073325 RepID=A0A1M5GAA5_SALEC|nr:cation:proton antiporter [Salegentibacter echinorum]SHG00598.1 multisubunit sodium/proton antiporter, MrpF subunit [Salegentibacter echinorum]